MPPNQKQYELIVLGATGYTGKLCAEHVTTSLPTTLKWAVAGRSQSKLSTLVDELKTLNADRVQPGRPLASVFRRRLLTLGQVLKFRPWILKTWTL